MTWDDLFGLASMAVVPGWLILIAAPRGIRWLDAVPRLAIPLGLSVLYGGLMLAYLFASGGGFNSIAQVRALFASDPVLVAGWAHYLAFDLLIGGFIATRMDAAGVHRLIQAPILVATFLLGPVGLLAALITETGSRWLPPKEA